MNFRTGYSVIGTRKAWCCMREPREYFEAGLRAVGIDPLPLRGIGKTGGAR